MPVTAKLSRDFYERFGDEIANELVEWFNSVDATYRADLRELNELNFARFDAKLEQRMAALEAKLEQRMAALEAKLEQRMAALEAKLEQRMAALEAKLGRRMDALEARMEVFQATLLQRLDERIHASHRELLLWILGGWGSLMLVLLGTLFAVLRAR